MKLDLLPIRLWLKKPILTARGELHERAGWRVRVHADGVIGRGEALPLEAFGTERLGAAFTALQNFDLERLPTSVEDIATLLTPLDKTPACRFAVECALLEVLALQKGLSVAALLGGTPMEIPVNALIEGVDAAALAEDAERAVAAGFRTVKIKVAARTLSVDAQRLLSVRRAVGNDVAMRIDANGGWSEAQARSILRGFESLSLELCEQPVRSTDVDALRRVKQQVPMQIAADEAVRVADAMEPLLKVDPEPAAHALVFKPMASGSVVACVRAAKRASAVGVDSIITTLIDGPIARAACAHLAASVGSRTHAHGLATAELFSNVDPDALTPKNGRINVTSAAGWGVA